MTIRPPIVAEWSRIGQLSELLGQTLCRFDSLRVNAGDVLHGDTYVERVREEVDVGRSMIRVAIEGDRVIGYVFAGVEPASWKELRPEAGYVHDLVVEETHRRAGVGRALLASAVGWFHSRGVQRVMLWTSPSNAAARRLFREAGFRETMIEMTLDAGGRT